MMYLWELTLNVVRIVFLRGSPERIYYTRRLFLVALTIAIAASAATQVLLFGDHLTFVVLRVFAELTLFMLMMVLLTAKVARFRLVRMGLALVLISLFADMLLTVLSPLFVLQILSAESARMLAFGVAGIACYGAANALAWGLQKGVSTGLAYVALYAVAVQGLDFAFRSLYQMMASAG